MKISPFAPLLCSLFLGGCDEKSHDMPAPPPDTRRIVDLTVAGSFPEGMEAFHQDMNELLAEWNEVKQADFYYEDRTMTSAGMPWQEGRFRDTKLGKSASWR